jgi:DNA-binding NarL/FixJ family response regulator
MSPSLKEQARLRVLLRTATPTLARGFLSLAATRPEIEAAACEAELSGFLDRAEQYEPAVVLVDTESQVDFACITELRRRCSDVRVVLWIESISVEIAHHARAAGVRGVLRKNAGDDLLIRCLREVAAGELWFERSLLNSLLEVREVRLSPRERQLLRLVAHGLSNKQLAAELMISEGTVKVYLAKLFRKVGVHDRYELAIHGLRSLGLTSMHAANAMSISFTSSLVLGAGPQSFVHETAGRTREQ